MASVRANARAEVEGGTGLPLPTCWVCAPGAYVTCWASLGVAPILRRLMPRVAMGHYTIRTYGVCSRGEQDRGGHDAGSWVRQGEHRAHAGR